MAVPKVDVLSLDGKKASTVELSPDVFDAEINPIVMAHAVRYYRNRMRAGTAAVKTRAEVRGSKRKMWAQKHTGRARHADAQAPQFRGGGRAHGPKACRASIRLPRQLRRISLCVALSDKIRGGKLCVLDMPAVEKPSTHIFRGFESRAGRLPGVSLYVFDSAEKNAHLSVSNMPNVRSCRALSITTYDVMAARSIVLTRNAVGVLTKRLAEESHG